MHKEILTKEQTKFLPLVERFSTDFGLVGGTAIALHIGHRQSIDFDLFTLKKFGNISIKNKIGKSIKIQQTIINKTGEFTFIASGVKFTFFHYPFKINFSKKLNNIIHLPDLLTLAAMKAYALGMRAKWKDYVDLYFILEKFHSLKKIVDRTKKIFGNDFNEKIFRTQLAYFKDIDYSEKIIYMKGYEIDDKSIEKELIKFSLMD